MIRIAIIGPESTGKSVLSQELASYFKGDWIPEYAREYIEQLDRPYNYNDVCEIAINQIQIQQIYLLKNSPEYVFFDTELIITKVWFEYCYKKIPDFLKDYLSKNYFDFYLLCAPDLPWIPDAVREHGTDREYFFDWYKNEIQKLGTTFYIVNGQGEKRTQNAIEAIRSALKKV